MNQRRATTTSRSSFSPLLWTSPTGRGLLPCPDATLGSQSNPIPKSNYITPLLRSQFPSIYALVISQSGFLMDSELIPGLPDEIARECLIRVPFHAFPALGSVCRHWQFELRSPLFHRLRHAAGFARSVVAVAQAEPPLARAASGPASKYAASGATYRLVLFDPCSGAWRHLPPIPSLPRGLPLFCQIASVGRELVVLGGWDPETWAASGGVHVYDFAIGSWREGAPMPSPRRSFFACAASAELRTVFVAGGHDEEKNALRSAMTYDVVADAWTHMPDMAQERDECRGVFMRGGGVFLVLGGYPTEAQGCFSRSLEAFDVGAWRWGAVEDGKLEARVCPRACAMGDDGHLYACQPEGDVTVAAGLTQESGCAWRKVAEVPEDVRMAPHLVAWDESLIVMGSDKHGGTHAVYVAETREGAKVATPWRRVAVPDEYAGHVQASCCLKL
ncbi:F-box/kelch-repeat protein At1g80440-like [Zingiber officinale]|uniref:F-box domain-containing protein n=1 Tax=Zingiber officinale TaxID=94328 RepID=A0A8J5FNR5_ZINOF|nr:F-box/kelch-repeat protein At1g80440-like [Zingiber officinale]KAG6488571.1 hypothetical protein ZIOFF_049818 [Zingiber officinale]